MLQQRHAQLDWYYIASCMCQTKAGFQALLFTFILTTLLALTPQCDQSRPLWKVAFEQPFLQTGRDLKMIDL